jgi:hypothetical protein
MARPDRIGGLLNMMRNLGRSALAAIVLALTFFAVVASAQEPNTGSKPDGAPSQESVAEIGAKLSNPVSDVWALFTQFGLTFSDGDLNTGDPEVGGNISFQPILPIPLYGSGADAWRLIVRPTIPLLFDPVPQGFDRFDTEVGLGDTLLPLPISVPAGSWILALGPTFTLPTSTQDAFGRQQWAVGPTGVIGYKTKKWIAGVFPQYFFGIGSRGDQGSTPDASYMSMLYFAFYNLPDAWQIGFNPTVSYDAKASSGNRWNVPVGLVVTKTTRIASRPVKFQFGFEYSVVSQDDFGQRFQIKLNVIPVISALIDRPLFGGD